MKYTLCFVCLLFCSLAFSQELVEKKNLVYGSGVDWRNHKVDLKLDLFYPNDRKKFPLVVFLHGGGFAEGTTKEFPTPFCEGLAKSGFAVANVEYRTGVNLSPDSFRVSMAQAIYRAVQDQKTAVRYLVRHSALYPIDTAWIFLAGESAGAVTSLFSAYLSQSEWDQLVPRLHSILGSSDSTRNDSNEGFPIKGVISLWGGIADTSLISKKDIELIPALLFHSEDDREIPYERISHPEAKQRLLHGSRDIANRFKNNEGCYQLYFTKGAAHAYGFSSDYLDAAISKFIEGIRNGHCSSMEVENKSKTMNLSFVDPATVAFPVEEDKIIKLSPAVLQEYAGKYKGSSGRDGIVIAIKAEGDHLQGEVAGEPPLEFFPLSDTMFLNKKYNNRLVFNKDATGKVIGHTLYWTRTRSFFFRKIE